MLSAALASAIDATATADSYADAHGRRVTFSSEDIRAFGLSIYISPPSATSCAPSCAQKTKPSARKPAPKSCAPNSPRAGQRKCSGQAMTRRARLWLLTAAYTIGALAAAAALWLQRRV
jgi:hypothetical protein